jgi:hypothetical protein
MHPANGPSIPVPQIDSVLPNALEVGVVKGFEELCVRVSTLVVWLDVWLGAVGVTEAALPVLFPGWGLEFELVRAAGEFDLTTAEVGGVGEAEGLLGVSEVVCGGLGGALVPP